jgi:hypothetical protein
MEQVKGPRGPRWLVRAAAGLDGLLGNFVGSAQIGPYVPPELERPRPDIACPSCGQPISRHRTEHTPAISRLYCPVPRTAG